jgi:hypothetical protein
MMTVLKTTQIVIDRIDKVEVEEAQTIDVLDLSRRSLTIWTVEGDKYELMLEAKTAEQLEFKQPDKDSWLTPKVYQGKGEES